MKKLFSLFALLALMSFAFVSCGDDDDYSLDKYWISYGTVEGEGSTYIIRRDDGSKLHIVSNLLPLYRFTDGQRIIANYTILDDATDSDLTASYYIRLNAITEVLTKSTIKQSFINADAEHRNDSIGNTPLGVEEAWIGSKYLNINFTFLTNPYNRVQHMISLVRNDIELNEAGEVVLTLRHNAFKDVPSSSNPMVVAFGRVSFDISAVVPEDAMSAKIRLVWEEYGATINDRETKYKTGEFISPSFLSGAESERKSVLGGELNKSPKESDYRLSKIATIVE